MDSPYITMVKMPRITNKSLVPSTITVTVCAKGEDITEYQVVKVLPGGSSFVPKGSLCLWCQSVALVGLSPWVQSVAWPQVVQVPPAPPEKALKSASFMVV